MKGFYIHFLLLFLLFSTPAHCQDFIVARVLAVSHNTLELIVASEEELAQEIRVVVAKDNGLPQADGRTVFPECVVKGADIRLWGETVTQNLFVAQDVKGCRHGGCVDPTGVRSRLKKVESEGYTTTIGGDDFHWEGQHSGGQGRGHGNHGGNGNGGGNGGGGNR